VTRLDKPVRRETCRTQEQGRSLIVTLEPGDTISFRQKGCRKSWKTTLSACFALAVKAEVRANQEAKISSKKIRRGY
jgi:hypothetical protein